MSSARFLLACLCFCLTTACAVAPAHPSEPTSSKENPMPFDTLVLRDVQGLFGGQNLYLQADGRCVVQAVEPGVVEQRYELTLSSEQLASLASVLAAHDLAGVELAERYGVPDEARPTLTLKTGDKTIEKAKWANDAHADFDAIYGALLAIVSEAKKASPVAEGKYDWDWKPTGF